MKLGTYKGLHARQPDLTVREEEVDNILTREQHRNAVIVHVDAGDHIRKIMETQPLNDDFALDFSDCDTLDEWRSCIREALEERRSASVMERVQRELLAQIIADSDIPLDPQAVQELSDGFYADILDDLSESRLSLQVYLQRRGLTELELYREQEKEAILALRSEAVLRAVADREGLTVLPEELAGELEAMAGEDGEDPAAFAEAFDDEDLAEIQDALLLGKAMDLILDHTIFE